MARSKNFIKEGAAFVSIGLLAVAFALGYQLFIIPNNFAPAGLGGIATMIQYSFGFSIGYFSLIINVPLCIYAFFFVDKKFAVRTLTFSLIYSGAYLLFQNLDLSAIVYNANGIDTIFPCLIAGVALGAVCGMCFSLSASTGGTDVVAKAINQKYPLFNFFWVTFVINALIAFSSLFVFGRKPDGSFVLDYKPVALCLLYCFTSNFIANRMVTGSRTAYKFMIVTPHCEALEADILATLHHSATRLHGQGIYTQAEKEILICVVNKHQIVDFRNLLKKYPETFVYVETVNETIGNFHKVK